jgi:hypothetical protein
MGREEFLRRYGFGPSRDYRLVFAGREYDSKAIAGVAHQFTATGAVPLTATEFSGGRNTVKKTLERLGFVLSDGVVAVADPPNLTVGQTYSWDELGQAFDFNPKRFQVAGGMLSSPERNAVLLITHPGGARSFDYEDRWDGPALIYTGRGKTGDQRLEGPNRDVADNRKVLFVFEAAHSRHLKYLGRALCTGHWLARAPDASGVERNVIKFRLTFEGGAMSATTAPESRCGSPLRTPRPFVPDRAPSARSPEMNRRTTLEETGALQEKANQQHHRILSHLCAALSLAGWQKLEEIPAAVDLWATRPGDLGRVIFEVKGLSDTNEIVQCRAALSQLLEYRFFYGTDEDRLCLVVDRPITDRRRAILESVGVGVVFVADSGELKAVGQLAIAMIAGVTSGTSLCGT